MSLARCNAPASIVTRVPNKPATQNRSFRIPDDLWEEILRVSADRGETATDLAIRALWREVRRWPAES